MKNLKTYASIALSGLVLAGTLSACKEPTTVKVNKGLDLGYKVEKLVVEQVQPKEEKIIQEMNCLVFDTPVESVKIQKTNEQVIIGRNLEGEKTPIYADKYEQTDKTTTSIVLDGEFIVCMDVLKEDGTLETKPFVAYTDLQTGDLVIFPNGVVDHVLIGTESASYEYNGEIIEQEIPMYRSVLSFTTGETVTEMIANIDVTNCDHIVLDSYLEAQEQENITR